MRNTIAEVLRVLAVALVPGSVFGVFGPPESFGSVSFVAHLLSILAVVGQLAYWGVAWRRAPDPGLADLPVE